MSGLRKGSRITGAERLTLGTALKKKYDKGAYIRDLAAETGRSYGFVHRVLTEAGTTFRSCGGDSRKGKVQK